MLCLYYNMYSITIGRRVSIKNRDYFLIGDGIVFEYIAKPKPQAQAKQAQAKRSQCLNQPFSQEWPFLHLIIHHHILIPVTAI